MTDTRTLDERFLEFHLANPHVFAFFEERCRQVYRPGRRIGMNLLIEQLRWQSLVTTTGDRYKINQSFSSRYARLLIAVHPEWDGLFTFRRLRSETAA